MSGSWQDSFSVYSKSVNPKLNYGKNRRHGSRQLLQMYYSYDDSERKRNGSPEMLLRCTAGTL